MAGSGRGRVALLAPMLASGVLLGGCLGSPTYGTDKTANEQLVTDLSSVLSLAPRKGPPIAYKPRPELVKPASTADLPPPQESIVTASNPNWPESPEQRLANIRAEATANQDNPNYESPVIVDTSAAASGTKLPAGKSHRTLDSGIGLGVDAKKQREAFNQRLAETKQGSETKRRYLSEPPLVYRQASESAPVNDIGEDELKKERRQKKAAKKQSGSGWWDWLPGT